VFPVYVSSGLSGFIQPTQSSSLRASSLCASDSIANDQERSFHANDRAVAMYAGEVNICQRTDRYGYPDFPSCCHIRLGPESIAIGSGLASWRLPVGADASRANSLFRIIPGIWLIYTKSEAISLVRFVLQQKISLRFLARFSRSPSQISPARLPQPISERMEISLVPLESRRSFCLAGIISRVQNLTGIHGDKPRQGGMPLAIPDMRARTHDLRGVDSSLRLKRKFADDANKTWDGPVRLSTPGNGSLTSRCILKFSRDEFQSPDGKAARKDERPDSVRASCLP